MHPSARTLGTDFDLFLGLEPQHSLFVVFFFFFKDSQIILTGSHG